MPALSERILHGLCIAAIGSAGVLAGCRGAATPQEPKAPAGPQPHGHAPVPPDVVERAALPYYAVRTRDGQRLDARELADRLSEADAVCFGEEHDNPHHHYAQLEVLGHLIDRAPAAGREVAVGLEMVDAERQPVLDAWTSFELGAEELRDRLDWRRRWGFDFSFYRPIFEQARSGGVPLIALNAPKDLTRRIARQGLDRLPRAERQALPELDLADAQHRAIFDDAVRHHPMKGMQMDLMYQAQVVWDETMAHRAANWLTAGGMARQVLILAGVGHCHESAVVRRIERRTRLDAVSVKAVMAGDEQPASSGPQPIFDYQLVLGGRQAHP